MAKDTQVDIEELKEKIKKDYVASKWHMDLAKAMLTLPWYKRLRKTKQYEYQREYYTGRVHIWRLVAQMLDIDLD